MSASIDVEALAAEQGFALVGVTTGEPLADALRALEAWCAAGHAGELGWMSRNPAQRADPRTLLACVRSVVCVAVPHAVNAPEFVAEGRFGRVARYAWGRDYHGVLLARLEALGRRLARALAPARFAVAADQSPLLERAAAARAGLGFVGKNTCLIRPRQGSWFLLGEVLLDRELASAGPWPAFAAQPPEVAGCGSCVRCLHACPTQAFVAPYVLDARRCISYWTIEHRGAIPRTLRASLGPWVFGCDVCQEVCPYNGKAALAPWPELTQDAGVGARLDLLATIALRDDAAFEARFAGTALLRAGREGLSRNACIAARNVGASAAVPALREALRHDASALVRAHALWALEGLDAATARSLADALHASDPAPDVRAEALAVLERRDPPRVAGGAPLRRDPPQVG